MRVVSTDEIRKNLDWPGLIAAIREAFAEGVNAPVRAAHAIATPDDPDMTLLLMPSWQTGDKIAVKIAAVTPGNAQRGKPTIHGLIALMNAVTGELEAVMDAGEVTARRTAAASALAADLICPASVRSFLMVGAGRLARNLIEAHGAVRKYDDVVVWARNPEKAADFVAEMERNGQRVRVASDLAAACAEADVISCATMATAPVVRGDWLQAGTHVDLVGAFRPDMRETDDALMRRARGAIYIDTLEGALDEAGDILQAIDSGAINRTDLGPDLAALCRGEPLVDHRDITVFKSVGTGLEDYAAARHVAAGAPGE